MCLSYSLCCSNNNNTYNCESVNSPFIVAVDIYLYPMSNCARSKCKWYGFLSVYTVYLYDSVMQKGHSCISKSLNQHLLWENVERPFCNLQILAKSQLPAAVCHSTLHTGETPLHPELLSSLSDLLHVFNWNLLTTRWPVCRGMLRSMTVRKMSVFCPHITHPTLYELWMIIWRIPLQHSWLETAWEPIVAAAPYDRRTMI